MLFTQDKGILSKGTYKNLKKKYKSLKKLKSKVSSLISKGSLIKSRLQSSREWSVVKHALNQFMDVNKDRALQYLKLQISFLQVLSSFLTFNVSWPPMLLSTMEWVKGTLFLDVLQLPGLSCLWIGVSFKQRLLTYTLGPLVVVGFLIIPLVYAWMAGYRILNPAVWETVTDSAWKNIMFWIFLVYPIVSLTTLQAFDCQPTGLGRLAADYSQQCPSYTDFACIWSFIFIVVYPVGIPLFCFVSMLGMGVHFVARDKINCSILSSMVAKYVELTSSVDSRRIASIFQASQRPEPGLEQELTRVYFSIFDENGVQCVERLARIESQEIDWKVLCKSMQEGKRHQNETVSFNNFKDLVYLEWKIAKVYRALFDDDGKWRRSTQNAQLAAELPGIELKEMEKFVKTFYMHQSGKVSITNFRMMIREALRISQLFIGVEGDRLSKEQAVALLVFDWKSVPKDSAEGKKNILERDSRCNEKKTGSESSDSDSSQGQGSNEEENNEETSQDTDDQNIGETETPAEKVAVKAVALGIKTLRTVSHIKKAKKGHTSIHMQARRAWLERACAVSKERVSAEIRKLGRALIREKLISIPDISWPHAMNGATQHPSARKESNRALQMSTESDQRREDSHEVDEQENTSEGRMMEPTEADNLQDYVIHPDLEDIHQFRDSLSTLVTAMSCFSLNAPPQWTTVNKRKELEKIAIRRVGFVFAAYKVNFWFWEMVEITRKCVFSP